MPLPIFSNYTVIRELGQGGMATVYLATHNTLGHQVAIKILDKQFTYRYAGDILKWAFAARGKNENLRVICSSKAEHESQIEEERIEIIECMKEIFLNPVNVYRDMIETQFSQIGLTLPVVSIEDLPLEIWAMPQIEGETGAIQLL